MAIQMIQGHNFGTSGKPVSNFLILYVSNSNLPCSVSEIWYIIGPNFALDGGSSLGKKEISGA